MDVHHVDTRCHRRDGLVGIASLAATRDRLVFDLLEEVV